MMYLQRFGNRATNCDILGQSIMPVSGQLFGHMDELGTKYGILIFLCLAPCTLLGLRLCFSLCGLSLCWAGHKHLRQINRWHWRHSTIQVFSIADRKDRKAVVIIVLYFVVSRIATTRNNCGSWWNFVDRKRPEMELYSYNYVGGFADRYYPKP